MRNQEIIIDLSLHSAQEKWKPPMDPWYKLNVDAAIDKEGGIAGLGCIVRNSDGAVMASATIKKLVSGDVEQAEALAILEGVKIACDSGLQPLIVESDAINVVNLINGKLSSKGEIIWIISEIQNYVRKNKFLVIKYVPRTVNVAAHHLAKLALLSKESSIWMEETPQELEHFL
ncbi:Ribonuclease H-like domain containing protein [Melia azedarach]|uniref:Ribonuclease H-like domain containing protein n=1 Tax=Melia azedarach TaxID=155640 RepID=A0ACC1Y1J8_MELAZ|nr:Ribonuclease H-like domain containing protein [Melia azedarach]